MSLPKQQAGFTLIEIMLFLAVSGLMLVLATVGISQRTQNVQYMDSIRSIESYFNNQRTNIINGVNTRLDGMNCTENGSSQISITSAGGEQVGRELDCVVNGKEFVLTTTDDMKIHTYDIATLNEESQTSISHIDQLDAFVQGEKVGRIEDSHNPHGVDWLTTFVGAVEEGSVAPINEVSFLFIRSIFNSQSYVYVSLAPGNLDDGRPLTPGTYQRQATGYHLCFESADEAKVTDIFLNQSGTFELRSTTSGPCEAIS